MVRTSSLTVGPSAPDPALRRAGQPSCDPDVSCLWQPASVATPGRMRRAKVPATPLARTRRARQIAARLGDGYPDARCELDFSTPLELAVATILSAQSTDARVNMVTPALFTRFRTAPRAELEKMIQSTGFFRNKATSLIGLGQALVERFDGELPSTLPELVSLPGFGRKTANVVLGHAFGVPGITVDTHVTRMATRWGLTTNTDPVKIEFELNAQLPPDSWTVFSDRAIFHGRRVCHAKKPACGACFLAPLCASYGIGTTDPVAAAALVVGQERPHLLSMVGLADGE